MHFSQYIWWFFNIQDLLDFFNGWLFPGAKRLIYLYIDIFKIILYNKKSQKNIIFNIYWYHHYSHEFSNFQKNDYIYIVLCLFLNYNWLFYFRFVRGLKIINVWIMMKKKIFEIRNNNFSFGIFHIGKK